MAVTEAPTAAGVSKGKRPGKVRTKYYTDTGPAAAAQNLQHLLTPPTGIGHEGQQLMPCWFFMLCRRQAAPAV